MPEPKDTARLKVNLSSGLLARNSVFNLIGRVLPLLVAVVAMPAVIRGLGKERYGLLSLTWVVLGSLSIFDLGLSRATTKFVAEAAAQDDDQIPSLVWTSTTIQLALGILVCLGSFAITPLLVTRVLSIDPALYPEARWSFYVVSLSLPITFLNGSFRGVLEAYQRFDAVNAISIPSDIAVYVIPLLSLIPGISLPTIIALVVLAKLLSLLCCMALVMRMIPGIKRYTFSRAASGRLFNYGISVFFTNLTNPFYVYFDRFLIGSLLSLTTVTYYTAPYDAVTRLGLIPTSLVRSLFPAFSSLSSTGKHDRLAMLFGRSIKYILLILGPIVLIILLFASDILMAWLGPTFAENSSLPMQIIAVGVLFNAVGRSAYALLHGLGRADITAKLHFAEIPLYCLAAWMFTSRWGITGAALAWSVRVACDTVLLMILACKTSQISLAHMFGRYLQAPLISLIALICASFIAQHVLNTIGLGVVALVLTILLLLALFMANLWLWLLDDMEKNLIFGALGRLQAWNHRPNRQTKA